MSTFSDFFQELPTTAPALRRKLIQDILQIEDVEILRALSFFVSLGLPPPPARAQHASRPHRSPETPGCTSREGEA